MTKQKITFRIFLPVHLILFVAVIVLLSLIPSAVLATTFSVDTGRRYPVADIHFIIITDHHIHSADARNHSYNDEETLRHFVRLLNKRFVSKAGDTIIRFRFKSMTSFADAKVTTSAKCLDVVNTGQKVVNLHGAKFNFVSLVNACLNGPGIDRTIANPNAINVYIYDAKSKGERAKEDRDSSGNFNNGQPVLRIDYARIYNNGVWDMGAVFEHEMGHGFNLGHVCNDEDSDGDRKPDGDNSTPSNIMSSANSWPPNVTCHPKTVYGGNRSLGFRDKQVKIIISAAQMMTFVK